MNQIYNWTEPVPLRADISSAVRFPVNALPPVIREMAIDVSKSTSTDVSMAGTALLSSASYCFSGIYRMAGKTDHTEPLVLDTLIVAEPSFKKSPVINMIKSPYVQYSIDWNIKNQMLISRNNAEKKILTTRISELEKKKDVTADGIAELEMQLSGIGCTSERRIAVDDVTPEALVGLLYENKTLLMISDEPGSLMNFNGRYTNSANTDLIIKSWSGDDHFNDRAGRGCIILRKPYMSICLACQPYFFENIMKNQVFRGSGLVARFLYCFPKSNIGHRKYNTESISLEMLDTYNNLICKLLDFKFSYNTRNEMLLTFEPDAAKCFAEYYNDYIEKQLVSEMIFCRDWGGKYHGQILRICGIIHCIKCSIAGRNPEKTNVDLRTLCNAIEIGNYYREMAIYGYSYGETDRSMLKAERVINKIREKQIHDIGQNELYQICRGSLFENARSFNETIEMLSEYRYLICEKLPGANGNNKSKNIIHVNPYIFNMN